MAVFYDIQVRVHRDKTIDRLGEVIRDIDELTDLIPEWNQMEAQAIRENLFNNLNDCIETEATRGK